MFRGLSVLIVIINSYGFVSANDGFPVGYIITNDNDTLVVKIKAKRNVFSCYKTVEYRIAGSEELKTKDANEVKRYYYTHKGVFYDFISQKIDTLENPDQKDERVFIRVEAIGYLTLYSFVEKSVGVSSIYSGGSLAIIPYPKKTIRYAIDVNNGEGFTEIKSGKFIGQMVPLLSGNDELISKIKNNEYAICDIRDVVVMHNNWYYSRHK